MSRATRATVLRKRWKIYTGTRSSNSHHLNRSDCDSDCLAEDGCADSQLALAKHLLNEGRDGDVDNEENDRLGVYWLMKASEQGHREATALLQTCLRTGRGISERNVTDVRACLAMSVEEKLSRLAVRHLFTSLSQGEDYITSDQLYEEMQKSQTPAERLGAPVNSVDQGCGESSCSSRRNENIDWVSRPVSSPEKLTEDALFSAAHSVSRGELPIVDRVLTLSHRSRCSLPAPVEMVCSSYYSLVNNIGKRPLRSFVPVNRINLQTLAIFALYSFFGFDGLIEAAPSFIYYTSLVVMVITTCRILSRKWELNQLRQWSNLLVAWGGPEVNAERAHCLHSYNNVWPCFVFLVSLIINILIMPFVPVYNVPHSELVVVSVMAALITLCNFLWYKDKFDFLVLVSFVVSVLARYPYETDDVVSQSWRFMDVRIPSFASYVVGNGIEFCFNFRALFYTLMPGLLIKMASRNKWRGVYTTLVPHLISLSWWQMAVSVSSGATKFGLIRSALVVIGVVLFLPLAGILAVLLPVLAFFNVFLATGNVFPVSASLAMASVCLVLLLYLNRHSSGNHRSLMWIQVCLVVLSSALLLWPNVQTVPQEWSDTRSHLTWAQYRELCPAHLPSRMKVAAQQECTSMVGRYIHWEGTVEEASITSVHNSLSRFVSQLPLKVQSVIKCMYGIKIEPSSCNGEDSVQDCHFAGDQCHLSNWNRYEYKILVRMMNASDWAPGYEVVLLAGHAFYNFMLSLSVGDRIWFSGTIDTTDFSQPNNSHPKIILHQAGCHECSTSPAPPPTTHSLLPTAALSHLQTSFKNLFNFFFNPVLVFK